MGSAASLNVSADVTAATDKELQEALVALPEEQRTRLRNALGEDFCRGEQWKTLEVTAILLSGEKLSPIEADASWTGLQVKSALAKRVDKDSIIKDIGDGPRFLQNDQTLGAFCSTSTGSVELQAVLRPHPEHQFWQEFIRYCPGEHKMHKMLIAADEKITASTINLVREKEAAEESSSEDRLGRQRFVILSKDVNRSRRVDEDIVAIPSHKDHTDVSLILDCCRSHSVDAVIVGSGTIGGSDPKLVHKLKAAIAEAGLQIVVFGKCQSVDTPPAEPAAGWKALSTTPPAGMRTAGTACVHCRDVEGYDAYEERRVVEPIECELGMHLSAFLRRDGTPCASWFHCTACGAACEGPGRAGSIGSLIGGKVFGSHTGFVFKSSLPEAAGITFTLYLDHGEDILVESVSEVDGDWTVDETEKKRPDFFDEQDSYLERLRAFMFEECGSEAGPGKPIKFVASGYRRTTEQEIHDSKKEAKDEEDEDDEEGCSSYRKTVTVKRGKWQGFGSGVEWDDGEMWICLGILKVDEEEE